MKIGLYCPNKPLTHPEPSGDRTIARGLFRFFNHTGNECIEIVRFRSRWFWRSASGWTSAAGAAVEALGTALRFRPDVWLTYHSYYKAPDVIGPLVCGLLRIPYFLLESMYGTKWRKRQKTRTGFYLNRVALKSAQCVFVNNPEDTGSLERLLPKDRLVFVPPGIFPEEFERDGAAGSKVRARWEIPPETPLILSAAMFRPGAKFESLTHLFRSLSLLRQSDFRLLIAGDGSLAPEIKTLADSLLPGRTVFAGAVPRERMAAWYSAADIFAFPGIRESIGMVYLEAQSCGLPVVALDSWGAARVVENGRTGLLVPQSEASFAEAVGRLLDDPALRRSLGAGGARYVREKRNLWENYRVLTRKFEQFCSTQSRIGPA